MKIKGDSTYVSGGHPTRRSNNMDTKKTSQKRMVRAGEFDKVEISGPKRKERTDEKFVRELKSEIMRKINDKDTDRHRIAAIRKAVSEGTYRIDAEKIADRMLGL